MKKLLIVGLGPGAPEQMTYAARAALEEAQVLCGYTLYVQQVRGLCPDTPVIATGMMQEIQRCRMALEEAAGGRTVAMVCSGDAGVYGMAGLICQLAEEYPEVDLHTVPGVTAALGGAAVLGAPLSCDFAVISLSDLLTPWEVIQRRLECAAQADMAIVLYNPSSRRRSGHLARACDILLRCRSGNTVCGMVRSIGREGQESRILTLEQLRDTQVDMLTTVFIGSSSTVELGGKMVTPRGYERKADFVRRERDG